jgi:hypothetical protein
MRKRLITPTPQETQAPNEEWLDLESAAVVEVTSEEIKDILSSLR